MAWQIRRYYSFGCNCQSTSKERLAQMAAKGLPETFISGTTKAALGTVAKKNNLSTGLRWVTVKRNKGEVAYIATLTVAGKKYYKYGFSSAQEAHEWAKEQHRRALANLGLEERE